MVLHDKETSEDGPETPAPVGNQVQNQRSSSPGGGFTQTAHRVSRASYLSQP